MDFRLDCPGSSRIRFEVDLWTTPEALKRALVRVRGKLLRTRPRRLTKKHLRLAVFSSGRRLSRATWGEIMVAWNERHAEEFKQGTYDDPKNFQRDCREAQRKLLRPPISQRGMFEAFWGVDPESDA